MQSALLSVLVCFLFFYSATADKKSYAGYQVVRLNLHDNTTNVGSKIQYVQGVAEKYLLDIWATNAIEGWMDVMLPPALTSSAATLFSAIPYTMHIADVQQSIDESEQDRLANAKADEFFSEFQTYGAITQWLQEKETANAERKVFGESYQGTNIYGLHLGEAANDDKPVIIIQCGIHAREWITPATCCWIIDQLLNEDPDGPALIDYFEFIIIPVLNVDGYDYTHTNDRLWRKNRQPNPGSTCVGTDLNRNYAYGWSGPGASNNPCSETFYGQSAFSGAETAAIRDLIESYVNEGTLVSYWDLHAYSALWMSAWGYTCNSLPTDFPRMNAVMTQAVTACRDINGNTYAFGSICRTIYQASGSSVDYGYGEGGIIHSYTTEAYGNSFTPPVSYIPLIGSETWAGVKRTAQLIQQELNEEDQ